MNNFSKTSLKHRITFENLYKKCIQIQHILYFGDNIITDII